MLDTVQLSMQGHLRIYTVNPDTGERECIFSKRNQITDSHLEALAMLVTQRTSVVPAELAFNSMKIEASATALAAPSRTDTGPTGTVVKTHVFDRNADVDINVGGTPGLLQFRALIGKGEANGNTLRAAGIYTSDDGVSGGSELLVARQIFPAVPKTSDLAISFEWDIQYTIVT